MTDENQSSLVLPERLNQSVNACHIEMRRRFVHQQKVGGIKQQLCQHQSAFLSAAKHADPLKDIVAAKQECSKQRPHGLFRNLFTAIGCFLQNRMVEIQRVNAVLRTVTNMNVVPKFT